MAKKKSAKKETTKKKRTRKKKAEPASRGLDAAGLASGGGPPGELASLQAAIEKDGGSVLGAYKDPLGGNWQLIAGLPVDQIEPTPFQRDLSSAHVSRLSEVLDKLDRYLDPIVVVRTDKGEYWTPNGGHRLAAMRKVGAKSIVCLVVPEVDVAFKILALNTEKAHSLGEKCLEVIRMARSLVQSSARGDKHPESHFALEFEDPAYLTLGCCYEQESRFSGSSYTSVLKRLESFFDDDLASALEVREKRGEKLRELDEAVRQAADKLKKAGFVGSAVKGFVIDEVNPHKDAKRGATADFEPTIDQMIEAARAFDPKKADTSKLPRL